MLNMTPDEVPATGGSAPEIEDGVYPAVICLIADLGVQRDLKFDSMNKPEDQRTDADYKTNRVLWYGFALPTERYEAEFDGEVVVRDPIIGKRFSVSKSDKSNLVKMYKALVKDGRNYGAMAGMGCMVEKGSTNAGKAKIVNVSALMKGIDVADPLVEPMIVSEEDWDNLDNIDIPDFIKELINTRVQ